MPLPDPRASALAARTRPAPAWGLAALELPAAAFALAACTSLPSRMAIATQQSAGFKRVLYVAGGLLGDVGTVGPAVAVALALLAWSARRGRRPFDVGLVALLVFLGVSLLAQNAATEFRFERGVLPGPIDARESLGHRDFLTAEGPQLLAGRFLWMNVVSLAVTLWLTWRLRSRLMALAIAGRRYPHVRGLLAGGVASVVLLGGWQRANAYCATLHNRDALASPSAALASGLLRGGAYDGSPAEVRRLLLAGAGSPSDAAEGARNMGFAPEVVEGLTRASSGQCAPHPLARSLDAEAGERGEAPIVVAARALSRALFRDSGAPPIVFHVSLESLRADDVHAINADAPAEIAPFLSEVYSSHPSAAAFAHAHQSGVKTSQALSAVMCGMGALPFNLSMGRDLGPLPLRCLPDVLADAGFVARAFYGHEFVFDDMGTFLHAHHMALHEREAFSVGAPRGVWNGVSDAEVYAAAADSAEATEGAQYNFILTLSHHTPYTIPDDLSPALRATVDEVCRSRAINGQNCDRLKTLRYADEALRRFVARVESSKNASRTIIVAAADHTTHQWVPWRATEPPEGITQIPLFVWLPPALRQGARDPAELAVAWDRFRDLAKAQPISNSDLPTVLLALLGRSAPLQALPAEARWHTLGGQTTSPHYRSVTGSGVAHGIDAHGVVFDVTETGVTRPSGTPMETLRGADDITNAAPHNRPEIAFWGRFLSGYVVNCTRAAQR